MKNKTSARRDPDGFSLIELLVVIGIIVVLAAITIGGISWSNRIRDVGAAKMRIGLLKNGLESYNADNGEYPLAPMASGRNQSFVLYDALFPWGDNADDEETYVPELDPMNDQIGWLEGQQPGMSLTIYDPWGNEFFYRSNDPSNPTQMTAASGNYDLW